MHSMIKFPLLALLCVFSADVLLSRSAIAGSAPIVIPESGSSGVADNYVPQPFVNANPDQLFSVRISSGIANALRIIEQRQSVSGVGQTLPLSPTQLATLKAAFFDLEALEQQLANEMGGQIISLSALGSTQGDLRTAIESVNAMIMAMNPEQLEAARKSPTFLALLQLLKGARDALGTQGFDYLFEGTQGEFVVINMSFEQ